MTWRDAENLNALWAGLLVEELVRQSVQRPLIIACPGSRSSPLAIATARLAERMAGRLEVVVAVDERCAGYIALGAAADGREPIVITTSGTAVANLMPACVEASASERPILFVTADRPSELLDCGANQTIRQRDLFGGSVRWSYELPLPTEEVDPSVVLSVADEARRRARMPTAGPVHLNVPFREPLAPISKPYALTPSARLEAWAADPTQVWRAIPQVQRVRITGEEGGMAILAGARRGAIVAGAGCNAQATLDLARAIRWPIIADIGSGLRTNGHSDVVVPAPDLIWSECSESLRGRLRPDVLLRIGGPLTSKRLNQSLLGEVPTVLLRSGATRFDDRHAATAEVAGSAADLLASKPAWHPSEVLDEWRLAGAIAESQVAKILADAPPDARIDEPWLVRRVLAALPPWSTLVLGNSMPIRDADLHAASDGPQHVVVNRGASGIDGLVSTAVGAALSGRSTTLLVGDLSLLHDLGGLANVRPTNVNLNIVVINNDGGGIFHFLPLAEAPAAQPSFERFFGTPHGLHFETAATMFGLRYTRATDRASANEAIARLAAHSPQLIECATDRRTNVAAHRRVREHVARALRAWEGRTP
jgi:2-succinyl-5-enolpyruvyl-6-hydroxy-3-cyclohexene-1-carboxylate synthase